MNNRDRIPASMMGQRRPEDTQNRLQDAFRQPMHPIRSQQQRQPLQQPGRGSEQKVIKKEDIPRLNSAPEEVKQVEVEYVAPYDE